MSEPPTIRVLIGGTALFDVTDRVRSLSTNRGRSRQLDRFQAGVANLAFDNRDRAFDPFNTASPFYPTIRPRTEISIETIISASTVTQFAGVVEDWNLDFEPGGDSIAFAACADGFVFFGGQQLEFGTATAEASGARINAILDRPEVAWPSDRRDIDTGQSVFGFDVIDQGRETLDYLQLVETSELGQLFMTKDNDLAFRERNRGAVFADVSFSDETPLPAGQIPYQKITISYGTEFLYNRATISNIGGSPQTQQNADSIGEYGVSSLEFNGLLVATEEAADAIAGYLVTLYGEPELRIDAIVMQLSGMAEALQDEILGLELTDIIRVGFQPNNIGDRIVQELRVVGVSHDVRPASHQVTLFLTDAGPINFVFAADDDASAFPFSVFAGTEGGTVYAGHPFGL
jgi:hypothetical protein